jgi:thioredoxin-like negative regulator of GroEL
VSAGVKIQDLLAPNQADHDWGADALQKLRENTASPFASNFHEPLPGHVADALLAWAVCSYECGAYEDAKVLLAALSHGQETPSLRLLKSQAANTMALGDYRASAMHYSQACTLTQGDAELLFYWAQAEYLQGRCDHALTLLEDAGGLLGANAVVGGWLHSRCQKLLLKINTQSDGFNDV